ncbi:amidohydrolase family protein [Curvibacter gracilis]|uniref:amidohydrolase family protein n=1 Tax=Curvibacter gracilis TaxID=230310 RepID=UPI0004847E81|nr:amidohydrolase family protein [Curvibacter gracilis]
MRQRTRSPAAAGGGRGGLNSPFPFDDTRPYVDALLQAFGLEHCLWASDWPCLKAPFRLDYGPVLKRWERHFTRAEWQQIMWDNPLRLFGFSAAVQPP